MHYTIGPDGTRETSIVVVAEHALVRSALCMLLNQSPGLAVVAKTRDLGSAVHVAAELRPNVVVLASQPSLPADAERLRALHQVLPDACIVCLEPGLDAELPRVVCLPQEAGAAEFAACLGAILPGHCASCLLAPQCAAWRVAAALSPRERQVAVRVARGMSTKQIAAALGVRPRTVNTYREGLARKLGASSGAVVTRYVLEHGLDSSAPGPLTSGNRAPRLRRTTEARGDLPPIAATLNKS